MAGPNEPNNKKYAYLRQLSMDKLLELLSVAPVPASCPEDEAYTDALEEAILEKENESPTGFLPDVNQQWAEFQKYYSVTEESPIPDVEALIEETSSAAQEKFSPGISSKRPVRSRRIWRAALTAAALAVCILGCMVAAQAAGVDVFGAMARWTESTFSLGTVRSQGAKKVPSEGSALVEIITPTVLESSSLQEVLDANEVTEVIAPTWIPKGYTLDLVKVDPEWFLVYTEYTDGTDTLQISIMSYTGEPSGQIEKNDKPPETFEIGGITFYLIENAKNYTVAWCTDHYECYICGALNQKENLKKIAHSMCLGTDRSEDDAKEVPSERSGLVEIITPTVLESSSLQEVLDANEVTEVIAPTWIPEEYALDLVDVTHLTDPELLLVYAEYTDGTDTLQISIMSYTNEPSGQIEKNDTPPETFEIGGITFYLIENTKNYTVAWCTDHYECYICGALNQKENLKKMVYSMYLDTDQTDGAGNEMPDNSDNNRSIGGQAKDSAHEYSSLQEALDAYGVTEVTAPAWIPEGYEFDRVDVLYIDDPEQLIIVATYYLNDGNPLHISIQSYTDEPNRQVEKTDTPPETFEAEGIMFYLVENTANYTVAWVTNHYECYIEGAKGMEAETLKDMVYSMFD